MANHHYHYYGVCTRIFTMPIQCKANEDYREQQSRKVRRLFYCMFGYTFLLILFIIALFVAVQTNDVTAKYLFFLLQQKYREVLMFKIVIDNLYCIGV